MLIAFIVGLLTPLPAAGAQNFDSRLVAQDKAPAKRGAGETVGGLARDARKVADEAATKAATAVRSQPWIWLNVSGAALSLVTLWLFNVIRPGSPARAGLRNLGSHPWWLWGLCALLTYVGAALTAGGVQALPLVASLPKESAKAQVLITGGAYAGGLAIALLLIRLMGAAGKSAGLGVCPRCLGGGFIAFLFAFPVVNATGLGAAGLHTLVTGQSIDTLAHGTLRLLVEQRHSAWAWSLAGLAVVGAPVYEEILYRGFVQSAFLHLTGKAWTSILLASGVFAAMHIPGTGMPWYAIATIFVLGVTMGLAYERTKRIGVPIVMHVLFNLSNVVMAMA